jgi:hypothetical protein
MIPRSLRILYWVLIAAIVLMAVELAVSHHRDYERMLAMRDQSPIPAPTDIPNEDVMLAVPSDADGSISLDQKSLALPAEPSTRARVLIDRLLTDLSLPASTHPVPPGPSVTDVFFLPLPVRNPAAPTTDDTPPPPPADSYFGVKLAVVNLTKTFADAHPSGIESEDLTLRAIIATIHANFADISEVRFLVDGQPRETLAGHADLMHAYAVQYPERSIHIAVE